MPVRRASLVRFSFRSDRANQTFDLISVGRSRRRRHRRLRCRHSGSRQNLPNEPVSYNTPLLRPKPPGEGCVRACHDTPSVCFPWGVRGTNRGVSGMVFGFSLAAFKIFPVLSCSVHVVCSTVSVPFRLLALQIPRVRHDHLFFPHPGCAYTRAGR